MAAAYLRGLTAEELCDENPHLDPSLFYAALAYFFANRELVEEQLDEEHAWAEKLMARYPDGITDATFDPNFDLSD